MGFKAGNLGTAITEHALHRHQSTRRVLRPMSTGPPPAVRVRTSATCEPEEWVHPRTAVLNDVTQPAEGKGMVGRLTLLVCALLAFTATPATAHHEDRSDHESEQAWWEDQYDSEQTGNTPVTQIPDVLEPVLPTQPEVEIPLVPEIEVPTTATIKGTRALVRADGKAAIPRGAPKRVRAVIAAGNQIVGKPYKWGGGHAKLADRGYDCSGAVSYALVKATLLGAPMVSGSLARWGAKGAGKWVSVYANKGHVYMEVAGLRLDTSSVGDVRRRNGVRWRPVIGQRSRFAARHPAGL